MKKRLKINNLFLLSLSISIFCAIYLNSEISTSCHAITENTKIITSFSDENVVSIAEVEVVKLFLEKILDIVSTPSASVF